MKKDEKIFWIVCKYIYGKDNLIEVCGLYDDERAALKRCTTRNHGLGPLPLNVDLSKTREWWPGFYYPSAKRCKLLKLEK